MATPENAVAVVEATIDQLSAALASGQITSVELVAAYLNRIAAYDRRGLRLNSTPILNPACFQEARKCDEARLQDPASASPLLGIPFTVKDSYKVAGLTVAAGSPAFARLQARQDSFAVEALRRQGALVLGKTNMPPMAVGGCQRGLYGRAESPYNPDYLPAAWHSGSSSGSGVAVSASLCAFGLGEETVSSGRSPASNGGLVAYTPSRGLVSIRGNWPLFPLRDTVVPHTRTVRDLMHVLNALVVDDPEPAGDLWKSQKFVAMQSVESVRPLGFDFLSLAAPGSLRGRRFGIPKMYIGRDTEATAPIPVRPSILQLMDEARTALTRLGATCVDVDFPAVSAYEKDRPGAQSLVERGLLPADWDPIEVNDLVSAAWEEFLRLNGDPDCATLANINPWIIHADPPEAVDTRRVSSSHEGEDEIRYDYIVNRVKNGSGAAMPLDFPQIPAVCAGLETARKELYEKWLQDEGLDGIVFPANADVAPSNADVDEVSSAICWQNGVKFSNTNHVLRHLGIPSVTVPMGRMADTGMPVGLTFAGPAYSDKQLLGWAYEYETASGKRVAPESTVELGCLTGSAARDSDIKMAATAAKMDVGLTGTATLDSRGDAHVKVEARVSLPCSTGPDTHLTVSVVVDGKYRSVLKRSSPCSTETFQIDVEISASERRGARLQSSLVVAVAELTRRDETGYRRATDGSYAEVLYQYL